MESYKLVNGMMAHTKKFYAGLLAFVFCSVGCASTASYVAGDGLEGVLENLQYNRLQTTDSGLGILAMIVTACVGVMVGAALLPTALVSTRAAQNLTTNGTAIDALIGLWPLMIIVGIFIAIVALAVGGII